MPARRPIPAIDGLKILLVEDRDDVRDALVRLFTAIGAQVIAAEDGDAAWRLFQRHACSVVLTDIMMPGLEVGVLCERIKASRPQVSIILMTGSEIARAVALCENALADCFLEKPFTVEHAVAAISHTLIGTPVGL